MKIPFLACWIAFATALLASYGASAQEFRSLDPENTIIMELRTGKVTIALRPDLAPSHVERIKTLARDSFYDGVPFHRVIPGFMAQGGDPTGTGTGGSDYADLRAEFSSEPHVEGTLSMARTSDPNSANSQFFVVFEPAPFLDNQYTVWGAVVDGMEHVHQIKKGEGHNGIVKDPDTIISMQVMADVQ